MKAERNEAHEVFKELSAGLNDLSKDMVKGLVALRAVSSDNRADIERVERRFDVGIEAVREKLGRLGEKSAAYDVRIKALESALAAISSVDGKVKVESAKGRWIFWAAAISGLFSLLVVIAQVIARYAGWIN